MIFRFIVVFSFFNHLGDSMIHCDLDLFYDIYSAIDQHYQK